DPAAWLTVPTAIDVWHTLDLEGCRALAARGRERLPAIEGVPAPQMWATELSPGPDDPPAFRLALAEPGIQVPLHEWEGRRLLRVSGAPYTTDEDLDRLQSALTELGREARPRFGTSMSRPTGRGHC